MAFFAARMSARVIQADVAAAAGVARATVSYALKNDPKIPQATRLRVQKAARELGYVPDPMLSSLAAYRSRVRPQNFHGTLAWLAVAGPEGPEWRGSPHYTGYFAGAVRQAEFHGYKLDEFILHPSVHLAKQLQKTLRARNITGIVLCPLPEPASLSHFPWKNYSAVALGYTLLSPHLHTVAAAHFRNTRLAIQKLREHGCRRFGLLIGRSGDVRCHLAVSAAHLIEQREDDSSLRAVIPPCYLEDLTRPENFVSESSVLRYIQTHHLDALLVAEGVADRWFYALKKNSVAGVRVAGISSWTENTVCSGIFEDIEKIGSVAVDFLVSLIQRGERGIPLDPIHTHVEGKWQEPPRRRSAKS